MTKQVVCIILFIVVLLPGNLGNSNFIVAAQDNSLSDITEIVWSNSGRYLAYGTYGGMIYVKNATTQQIITAINAFGGTQPELVGEMAWDATDTRLVAHSYFGKIRIWNAFTGQLLQTFASPPAPLRGVSAISWFNNDSQIISSHLGDGNSQTVFWDVATGNQIRSLQVGDILVMKLNRLQSLLAVAGFVGGVSTLNSNDFTLISEYFHPIRIENATKGNSVTQIAWSSNNRYIAIGSANGQVVVWDFTTKHLVRTLETTSSGNFPVTLIHAIWFDDNGFRLKALNGEGRLIVWDTQTWQIVSQQQLNGACVWDGQPFDPCIPYSADWSPDGRMLAYAAGPTLQVIPAPDLATPTPTPTSTVTPTSTPAPVSLRLQYYPDPDARGNLVESVEPDVNLVNTGTQAIPLSSLKIRYYFTRENPAVPVRVKCWFTALPGGCATVTGQVVALNPPVSGADSYLEIGFTGGTLAAGASTGEVLVGVNKTDWSDFDQRNDYSYTSRGQTFTDWDKIAVYRDGVLVWGVPPSGGGAMAMAAPSLTAYTYERISPKERAVSRLQPDSVLKANGSPAAAYLMLGKRDFRLLLAWDRAVYVVRGHVKGGQLCLSNGDLETVALYAFPSGGGAAFAGSEATAGAGRAVRISAAGCVE